MPQRRRNAGLSANSCGERGSCANSSASINSKRASRRKGKAPRRFFRKVCRRCKGAVRGAVMLPTPAPPSGACHHPRPQLGKGLQRHDLNSKLQVSLYYFWTLSDLSVSRSEDQAATDSESTEQSQTVTTSK